MPKVALSQFEKSLWGLACVAVLGWIFGLLHLPDLRKPLALLVAWTWYRHAPQLTPQLMTLQPPQKLSRLPIWVWLLVPTVLSVVMGALQDAVGQRGMYDQGIFLQVFWSLTHGHGFDYTISGTGNYLNDHFAPAIALLSPFFAVLGGGPFALTAMSSLLIWGGVLSWLLTVKKQEPRLIVPVAMGFFVMDSFWANLKWGFHESHLVFFTLSWSFYFLAQGRTGLALLGVWISALCKELYLLDMALLSFAIVYLSRSSSVHSTAHSSVHSNVQSSTHSKFLRTRMQSALWLVSGLLMLGLFAAHRSWLQQNTANSSLSSLQNGLSPGAVDWFKMLYGYLMPEALDPAHGQPFGPITLAKYALTHPLTVLERWVAQVGALEIATYPIIIFGLGGLAVFYSPLRLLGLGLLVSFAAYWVSAKPQPRDLGFHYVLSLLPVVWAMFLVPIQEVSKLRSFRLAFAIWLGLMLGLGGHDYLKITKNNVATLVRSGFDTTQPIQAIAQDAAVLTDESVGFQYSARRWIQMIPQSHLLPGGCPDVVVFSSTDPKVFIPSLEARCDRNYLEQTGKYHVYMSTRGE